MYDGFVLISDGWKEGKGQVGSFLSLVSGSPFLSSSTLGGFECQTEDPWSFCPLRVLVGPVTGLGSTEVR